MIKIETPVTTASLQNLLDLIYLKLDQTTFQHVINGSPQFDEGLKIKENKWVNLDGL